ARASVPLRGWRLRMLKLFLLSLVGAVCAACGSFAGCGDPQSLDTAHRPDEVSAVLCCGGVIGLPGVGVRVGGEAIKINKTWPAKKESRRISAPPAALLGRGGLAYGWSGPVVVGALARYFSPQPNSDLGAKATSDAVGALGAEKETVCGPAVRVWRSTVGPFAFNTYYDWGRTFEAIDGTSLIGHVCTPAEAAPLATWAKAWRSSALAGRPMAAVLNRTPLVPKMKMVSPIVGEGCGAFLDAPLYELASHRASFVVLVDREITADHAALLMNMSPTTALMHFSQDRKLRTEDDGLCESLLLLTMGVTQRTLRSCAVGGMLTKAIIIDDGSKIVKTWQVETRTGSVNAKEMREQ
ncbi:unnamed protein product, partial [Prorocentrum cordatum]